MVERKCLQCGTWNTDEKYCKKCGNPIEHEEIVRLEEKAKRIAELNKPKDKYELFVEKCKNHNNFIVRIGYHIMHTIGVVFAAIGAFMAWLIAMANA